MLVCSRVLVGELVYLFGAASLCSQALCFFNRHLCHALKQGRCLDDEMRLFLDFDIIGNSYHGLWKSGFNIMDSLEFIAGLPKNYPGHAGK
jgi:hypothetical protein